ncbi:uncharacterized protein LOC123384649 [Felis catus]|uniref:uncharacterized protein LOC123384649 n=1 Tax=Felis catus TaxID=9685 RepID=UPI001D19ACC9|nr:uncharacterized protein LOC123384649 [Felis catus]
MLVNGSLSLRHRVGPLCDPLTRRVLVYSMQRTSRDATFEKTWESGGCSLLRLGGERAGSQAAPGGQAALSLSMLGTTRCDGDRASAKRRRAWPREAPGLPEGQAHRGIDAEDAGPPARGHPFEGGQLWAAVSGLQEVSVCLGRVRSVFSPFRLSRSGSQLRMCPGCVACRGGGQNPQARVFSGEGRVAPWGWDMLVALAPRLALWCLRAGRSPWWSGPHRPRPRPRPRFLSESGSSSWAEPSLLWPGRADAFEA